MTRRHKLTLAAVLILILALAAAALIVWPDSAIARALSALTAVGLFGGLAKLQGGNRASSNPNIGSLSPRARERIDAVKAANIDAALSDARRLSDLNAHGGPAPGDHKQGR